MLCGGLLERLRLRTRLFAHEARLLGGFDGLAAQRAADGVFEILFFELALRAAGVHKRRAAPVAGDRLAARRPEDLQGQLHGEGRVIQERRVLIKMCGGLTNNL